MSFREGHRTWLLIAVTLLTACSPTPPPDAPADVHYVGGKTPLWRHCRVDSSELKVHCKIWTEDRLDFDEVFVPYDGGPTPSPEELKIFDNQGLNPHVWIYLENGRILIPVSRYEWSKHLLQTEWAHTVDERGYRIQPQGSRGED
jgi:hypothetical protein